MNLQMLILLLLIGFVSFGQKGKYNQKARSTTDDIFVLLEKAKKYTDSKPKKALNYVEEALELSIEEGNNIAEAYCYVGLGDINYHYLQYKLALKNYQKAETIFTDFRHDEGVYIITRKLAETYKLTGESEKSISYYNRLVDQAEKKQKFDDIVYARGNVADWAVENNMLDTAIYQMNEALEVEQNRNNPDGVVNLSNKLGNTYNMMGDTVMAMQNFQMSQQIATDNSDAAGINSSYSALGDYYRYNGDFDNELKVRQELLEINTSLSDKQAMADGAYEIGETYFVNDQVDEAIDYYEQAMTYTADGGDMEQQSVVLKSLSDAYEKKGDVDKAIENYKKYVELSDSLLKEKELELEKRLALSTELTEKQSEIQALEKQKELDSERISLLVTGRKFRNMVIYSLLAALTVLLIGSYLFYRSSRQKRRANQMLALKSLRSQMNPHFIFNSLNSVNNFISKSDERSANKYLSNFSRLMRMVMENSKYDFVSLNSELNILGLYIELEHSRFANKFDYEFVVGEDFDKEAIQLPPMLIQPFIENAIWHGLRYKEDKGFLSVKIDRDEDDLVIVIEDNGIGRQRSQEVKTKNQKETVSTGVKNIENRVKTLNELYNANIELDVSDVSEDEDTGTRVTINMKNIINN